MKRQTYLAAVILIACTEPTDPTESTGNTNQGGSAGAAVGSGGSAGTEEMPSGGAPEIPMETPGGAGGDTIAAGGASGDPSTGGTAGEVSASGGEGGTSGGAAGMAGGGAGGSADEGYGVSGCWITHTNSGETRLDLVENGSEVTGTSTYAGTTRNVTQGQINDQGMTFEVNWGSFNCEYTFDMVSPTMLSGESVCGTGIGNNRQNMTADRTCP